MKRLPETTFFSIMIFFLMTEAYAVSNINNKPCLNSYSSQKTDTTNLTKFLNIQTFKLMILPPSSGVQFLRNKIIFLSRTKNEKRMATNQISFGTVEAYTADVLDTALDKHNIFSPLSSFSYPCEAITFSKNYDTLYYTKFPNKGNREKIFQARFTLNNKGQPDLLTDENPLDFCSDNANYSHPALSSDGNMMIFSSDRANSLGGMDLFVSRKKEGKWYSPENLGKYINTTGNEFFPFLDADNNLYFSSDGLPGFGGYDIFSCKFNGVDWNKPVNLGDHINSSQDEIAFTINKSDLKTAFFTRRLLSNTTDMQLFRIVLNPDASGENLLTISYIFNGKPVTRTSITAVQTSPVVKPSEKEPLKSNTETVTVKKTDQKFKEAATTTKKITAKDTVRKKPPVINPPETKTTARPESKAVQAELNDRVIYKVQILPNAAQLKVKMMDINGKSYKIDQYVYLGAVRYTIGEFSSLSQAAALQRITRQAGYPQSFVTAFKNNVRSLDPALFK